MAAIKSPIREHWVSAQHNCSGSHTWPGRKVPWEKWLQYQGLPCTARPCSARKVSAGRWARRALRAGAVTVICTGILYMNLWPMTL